MAVLPVTAQQAYVSVQAYLGLPDYTHQTVIDFVSQTTFTANAPLITTVTVPANTTDQSVNLATTFPGITAVLFLSVADVTNPGQPFSITTTSGSGRIQIAASSCAAYLTNSITPPTLFLTNPSVTTASVIYIGILTN
jgi:hypothetical protein